MLPLLQQAHFPAPEVELSSICSRMPIMPFSCSSVQILASLELMHLLMCAEAKRGRQLLQASSGPINNLTVSVMVTKCSGTQPVDTASVAALVNGYTATNLRIPLSPTTSNPSLYSGEPLQHALAAMEKRRDTPF